MGGPEDSLRAGDADRQAVAERLRVAQDEGRLTLAEYDERLGRAYAATTFAQLRVLTADLPEAPARRERVPDRRRYWACGRIALVLVGIWLITSVATGHAVFFWPLFPLGIWALVLTAGVFRRHGR